MAAPAGLVILCSGRMSGVASTPSLPPLDTTVTVETPEHVRFRYRLAGPVRRAAAYAIDTALRGACVMVFSLLLWGSLQTPTGLEGIATGVWWVILFVVEWAYFVLFETLWHGQSPGKRLLRLRVVSSSGRPLGFIDSVLRNLLRAADYLPNLYVLGFAVAAVDARFRRLGDFVGGTLVVAEDVTRVEAPISGLVPPSSVELAQLPRELALRPRDVETVELFLRRRSRYSTGRTEELAQLAVDAFTGASLHGFTSASRLLEVLYFRAVGGDRVVSR
jgi:uncharacterized RDD family membrane protein YckC